MSSSKQQWRRLMVIALSGSAMIATPQFAHAALTENPPASGQYTASGAEVTPQAVSGANIEVTTDNTFSVNTPAGIALSITGTGALSYTDTNGSDLITASAANYGLNVDSSGNAPDLTPGSVFIQTNGDISGGGGVNAVSGGSGSIQVTTTGTVTGTSANGMNIIVGVNGNDLEVNAGQVTGQVFGIVTSNSGSGDTVITTNGVVTGVTQSGIRANNASTTTGNLTVTANDDVISYDSVADTGNNGIDVVNSGTGNTTVTAGNVTGRNNGIIADNQTAGNLTVTSTGTVNAVINDGINAVNGVSTGDLTVNANVVTGGQNGINTSNVGTGNTEITATGAVTGTANNGINAVNGATAGSLTIETAAVTGGQFGIATSNSGTGSTTITTNGVVTGTGQSGIRANNATATTGALTVTANADVISTGNNGIDVDNTGTGNTTVNAINVTGLRHGITAENRTAGNLIITTTGNVVGNGAAYNGINAVNSANTGDITVNANVVTGGQHGIATSNAGTGDTQITATGTVTGTANNGINAVNGATAGDLTVETAAVTGGQYGIATSNSGTGNTEITATGTVIGTTNNGINAVNGVTAGDLIVETAAVTGGQYGIATSNSGTGDTEITATGLVTGTANNGINAVNGATAGDLTVETAAVTGGQFGVITSNSGTGSTTITTNGVVTATNNSGIRANNAAGTTVNLTITANESVTGGNHGIDAENNGTGTTQVNVNDNTTGTTGNAVNAVAGATAGSIDVNIATGKVATGGAYGVATSNSGTGTTTIDAGGLVQGGTAGILANSSGSQAIEINVTGEVRNSSTASNALAISSTSGVVTINNNNVITGTVALGNQGNTFNNAQAWNTAGGTSTLGAGVNTFDNQFTGIILAATAAGGPVNTTVNGVGTFTHSGAIMLQNEYVGGFNPVAGDVLTLTNGGSGEFQSNNGSLYIDTNIDDLNSDRIAVDNVVVTGGATTVFVNVIDPGRATSGDGILVVDVDGTSENDAFVLAGPIQAGLFDYDLTQGQSDTQSWFLQSNFRDEVVAASALSVLGSRTALATLSNLSERQRGGENFSDDQDARKGVWARAFGQDTKFRSDGGTNAGFNANTWGAQAGLDLLAKGNENGARKYAGVYIGYATSNGDALNGSSRIGSLDVDATSVGAYFQILPQGLVC